ncbi:unnamed protein product [Parnassius apollo]|uniref:(apollo) hypothetical protein n=1 Tax=Parnassius apollo TaxID=110799 RepID=A0A8S3Y1G7_PARAO|nr:unnamed protein product [Parnassius apollo]
MFPGNVCKDLMTLVPQSIVNDISCFVFYDHHPRSNKTIDVLVCTQRREVIEFYKREQISAITLDTFKTLREVRSFRNTNCDLFYLVATEDELYILSSKKNLKVEHKVIDIESYEVYDSECSGQASLKLIRKDDAVPLFFDDNFENLIERSINYKIIQGNDLTPVLIQLMRKLTEAKYNVQCNENKYNEFVNLRRLATFYLYQTFCPNLDDSVFKIDIKEIPTLMLLKTWTPWVKFCNKKIVITFYLLNKDIIPLEDVYVLLHSSAKGSIIYVAKLFVQIDTNWIEKDKQYIEPKSEVAVVTSVDLKELQNNVTSRIEFDMVLVFQKSGKDYILPFDTVVISAGDIMGENFDILSSLNIDEQHTVLAVLATSIKTELCFRHIKSEDESSITAVDIFCKYLKMEKLVNFKNVVIHKTSPYHILYGVMVIFKKDRPETDDKITVEVYSRCPSQVLALIHYINDAVPFKIIVTTPNYKITANTDQLAHYNEEISPMNNDSMSYLDCASSVLNQTTILLEYLDNCMIKMNENKDQVVRSKVGSEIDMFACGLEKFIEFRDKLLNEVSSGIQKCVSVKNHMVVKEEFDDMIVDG